MMLAGSYYMKAACLGGAWYGAWLILPGTRDLMVDSGIFTAARNFMLMMLTGVVSARILRRLFRSRSWLSIVGLSFLIPCLGAGIYGLLFGVAEAISGVLGGGTVTSGDLADGLAFFPLLAVSAAVTFFYISIPMGWLTQHIMRWDAFNTFENRALLPIAHKSGQ